MARLHELVNQSLQWTQPRAAALEFELQFNDEILATLQFRSRFGSFAVGSAAGDRWTFKRQGFFTPTVTVRAEGAETELAVFRNRTWTGGGTIDLADGRHFLASTNFWHTRYEITTSAALPIITYSRTSGILHLGTSMELHEAAANTPELPWLAILGWYLKILLYRDASTAAASA